MQNRKKRRWPWVVLALVLTLLLAGAWLVRQARLAAQAVTYETYTVKKGSITSTVTGSGRLESADTRDVELPEGVDFAEVNVSVGDSVREGDRLAAFDPASLEEHAATLSSGLASIDVDSRRRRKPWRPYTPPSRGGSRRSTSAREATCARPWSRTARSR